MTPRERELVELLGAYALDAVDDSERAEIDEYLERSPRARAEVAEYLEVAAFLGGAPGEAPASIWTRIDSMLPAADSIDDDCSGPLPKSAPMLRHVDASVVSLTQRRSTKWWLATLVAAAAAVAVVALGISNVRQDRLIKDYKSELAASRDGAQRINDLLAASGTKVASLHNESGQPLARVILASTGEGYLVDSGLPRLNSDHTYQLWGVQNGVVLSLGVMGNSNQPIALAARGSWSKLVLTEESSPGVVVSTQPAVAAGIFSS